MYAIFERSFHCSSALNHSELVFFAATFLSRYEVVGNNGYCDAARPMKRSSQARKGKAFSQQVPSAGFTVFS